MDHKLPPFILNLRPWVVNPWP